MGERYAGRYELVDQLGEGAAGTVWRAWDHRAGRYVAAKLLRQRDAGALLRFVREQSLRVSHPHVAPPIGWAAEDEDVLLTMDLVAGGSVATLLGDYGSLPLPYALVLLDQLLDALAAVHAAGLVHRDVKPGNLLLEVTGAGRPFLRLGDFGIAAARGQPRLTRLGTVIGTPGYLAPDVLLGAEPAPHHDLWSVGVVGWQVLTGGSASPRQTVPLGPRPDQVPDPVWDWLTVLCAEEPGSRYVDAPTARAALSRAVDSSGLSHAVNAVGAAAETDPVEVFDHLAELPPGWTAAGPRSAEQVRTEPATRAPAARLPPTAVLPSGTPQSASPASTRRWDRKRLATRARLVGAALLVIVALVAFLAAWASVRSGGPPPASTPSRQVAPAEQGERVGQPCEFTEVGQRRRSDGQLIECRQAAGATTYRWFAVTG